MHFTGWSRFTTTALNRQTLQISSKEGVQGFEPWCPDKYEGDPGAITYREKKDEIGKDDLFISSQDHAKSKGM